MPHVAGRYYYSQIGLGADTSGIQPAVDVLYAQPILIPDTKTYTGIAIGCTIADASAPNDARLGIYTDGGGFPDALVLDAGTVSLATTGAKEIAISQSLPPGWYWTVYVSNTGSAQVRGYAGAGSLGWLGITTVGQTAHNLFWSVAFTYAALPNPFTGGGALGNANTGNIKVMLKI
jgi:hypothetical protein